MTLLHQHLTSKVGDNPALKTYFPDRQKQRKIWTRLHSYIH